MNNRIYKNTISVVYATIKCVHSHLAVFGGYLCIYYQLIHLLILQNFIDFSVCDSFKQDDPFGSCSPSSMIETDDIFHTMRPSFYETARSEKEEPVYVNIQAMGQSTKL